MNQVASESPYALLFPGQGSQKVGMGKLLYESSPAARAVFDEADEQLVEQGFELFDRAVEVRF